MAAHVITFNLVSITYGVGCVLWLAACSQHAPEAPIDHAFPSQTGQLVASFEHADGSVLQFREAHPGMVTLVARVRSPEFWQTLDFDLAPDALYEALSHSKASAALREVSRRAAAIQTDKAKVAALKTADPNLFVKRESGQKAKGRLSHAAFRLQPCAGAAADNNDHWCWRGRRSVSEIAQQNHHTLMSGVHVAQGRVRFTQQGWHDRFGHVTTAAMEINAGDTVIVHTRSNLLTSSLRSKVEPLTPEGNVVFDHWGIFK